MKAPEHRHTIRLAIAIGAIWTLLLAASLIWTLYSSREQSYALARNEARVNIDKDIAFRNWAASHGGVYVVPTATTPPNPYLTRVPDRDVVTTGGKSLTLMNPAYMLREMQSRFPVSFLSHDRITSLKPINPGNAPDDWERQALQRFEQGEKEIVGITRDAGGAPLLRMMRPFVVEKSCLKCHGWQGYKLGDIRGGIDVTLHLEPFLDAAHTTQRNALVGHLVLWLLGLLSIVLVSRLTLRRVGEQMAAQAELDRYRGHLETLVAERTAALRENEARYRTLADFTSDWETWLDEHGHYQYVSPSCLAMSGYSADEFTADPDLMMRILHPDDLARVKSHFLCEDRRHKEARLEFRILRRDGEMRWLEHVCQPVYTDDGQYRGRRAGNRDITSRKHAEVELAHARDRAEVANRAKSTFLASMSHELRTPLNAILGFVQLMVRDDSLSAKHRRDLDTISRSGQHLLELINDVLEISRIEAGKATVQIDPFDLDEALHLVEEIIRERANAKALAFRVERSADLPRYLMGDVQRLRQVLLNLLSNAVKYTERGGIVLRVVAEPERHLRFEVEDSGPGISMEEQQRLFQVFEQTSIGLAKGEGSGLGLAISHEYVRIMGGTLTVRSTPGKGSLFGFSLPLDPADAVLANVPTQHQVIGLEDGQPPIRVLVVEDKLDNRELLSRLLIEVGFEVEAVDNGEAAIQRFRDWQPHFIWMDMRMPGLDGYETTRWIRELPGGGEVKIVALTASAFRENREQVLAAGCDDMIAKPFRESQIFDAMAHLLGIRYRYHDTVPPPAPVERTLAPGCLNDEQRANLRRAAEALDIEAAQAVLATMVDRASAEALEQLLADYRFDAILSALDGLQ